MKKFINILLVLSAISLVGCGKEIGDEPENKDDPSGEVTPAEPATPEEPEEEGEQKISMTREEVLKHSEEHFGAEKKKFSITSKSNFFKSSGMFAGITSIHDQAEGICVPLNCANIIDEKQSRNQYFMVNGEINIISEFMGEYARDMILGDSNVNIEEGNEFRLTYEYTYDLDGYLSTLYGYLYVLISSPNTQQQYHGELEGEAYQIYTEIDSSAAE